MSHCTAEHRNSVTYCVLVKVSHCTAAMTSDTACLPYRIEYREGVGRMVVAVRDIMAGEVVLADTALLSGPGGSTPPVCCDCLSVWQGGYVCSRCGWPVCGPDILGV